MAHYSGGEYFKTHESGRFLLMLPVRGYQRRATVLVYLNDVAEGGATRFDKMNIDVALVKGKALLFFPGTKASMPDARTLHTAMEAVVGHEKWISGVGAASAGKHEPEGNRRRAGGRSATRGGEGGEEGGEEGGGGGRRGRK